MITREELYELVWSEPMTQIAEKLDVSGSYMIRVCNSLRVPRPGRGYWARIAAGQKLNKAPLPAARPGDQLTWSKGDELDPLQEISTPDAAPPGRRSKPNLPETHRVLNGAKAEFLHGYPTDDEGYLKPYKKLRVDITTSKASLDKALTLANDLFNTFEKAGYRVAIGSPSAPDHRPTFDEREVPGKSRGPYYESRLRSPNRPTLAYISNTPVGLAIIEMSEEVILRYVKGDYVRETDYVPPKRARGHDYTWTTTRELPSGRFRIIAFAPHPHADWSLSWQETKAKPLSSQLSAIVKAVVAGLPDMIRKAEVAQRQAEIEHQRWLEMMERHSREEDQRRIAQSYKDSKDHLARIMTEWTATQDVERFFEEVEKCATELPEEERTAIAGRLRLAREFLGLQDPLDILLEWKTPAERYTPIYAPHARQRGPDISESD